MNRFCPICGSKEVDWIEDFTYPATVAGIYLIIVTCSKCQITAIVTKRFEPIK